MRSTLSVFAATAALFSVSGAQAAEPTHEITITVKRVEALDKHDSLSSADDYARVTIAGDVMKSLPVKQTIVSEPNWKLSAKVAAGTHDVKLELLDKDLAQDDPIDINRLGNKRDLDFTVNTRTCRIDGFAVPYKCGRTITRAGKEKKKAKISFTVTVSKLK